MSKELENEQEGEVLALSVERVRVLSEGVACDVRRLCVGAEARVAATTDEEGLKSTALDLSREFRGVIPAVRKILSDVRVRQTSGGGVDLVEVAELGLFAHDLNNLLVPLIALFELMGRSGDRRQLSRLAPILDRVSAKSHLLETNTSVQEFCALLEAEGALYLDYLELIFSDEGERPSLEASQMSLRAAQLGRVVYNLATNARKAGAQKVQVLVQSLVEGELCLVVMDDGPGFKGVEPFKTNEEIVATGHGNGLRQSRLICERAGGTLRHGALDREGGRFFITVPLKAKA